MAPGRVDLTAGEQLKTVGMESDLLSSLPMPLAQGLLRARNAKSLAERHHGAYYLLEATLKLLCSLGAQMYLGRGHAAPRWMRRCRPLPFPPRATGCRSCGS